MAHGVTGHIWTRALPLGVPRRSDFGFGSEAAHLQVRCSAVCRVRVAAGSERRATTMTSAQSPVRDVMSSCFLAGIAESDNAAYCEGCYRGHVYVPSLSVTLMHTLQKQLYGMRCHLAGTLMWSQVMGPVPHGKGRFRDRNPQFAAMAPIAMLLRPLFVVFIKKG